MPFERGHKKVGGRRAGTPNRFSPDLRQMTLEALHRLGGLDYLVWLGRKHPRLFVRLLIRLMPPRQVEYVEQPQPIIQVVERLDAANPPPKALPS